MKREIAIKMIDDLANVVTTSIPDKLEIMGKEYSIKEDITQGNPSFQYVLAKSIY